MLAIVLVALEVAVVVVARNVAWKRLLSNERIARARAKSVMASLIRTSGHVWLLLAFVPSGVLVAIVVNAEHLEAPVADLLTLVSLVLVAWFGSEAVRCYRLARKVKRL